MKKLYDGVQRFCATHPRFGIPNLMRVIVAGNVAVYVLMLLTQSNDANALSFLTFNLNALLHGEIWRIVTFVFVPGYTSPLSLLITLYFYYWIGSTLERQWGTAKFTLYYVSGVLLTAAGVWFFAMGWRVLSAPEGRGTAMPPNAVQCLIPTAALLWVLIQRFSIIPAASARLGCTFRVLGALGALLCVGMLCKLLYVPGGTYGCTVQQYGSLAFYFATCHELPQAIFELVRGSVSEQTLLTSLAMGCIGLCGLAAMLTTVPRSNPTKKDKAD